VIVVSYFFSDICGSKMAEVWRSARP